jgi:hypothetical protein
MLVVGAALVFGLLALHGPATVRAASPEPSAGAGGDTRSAGEGPGLVGAPGLAIGGVVLLGLVSAGLTLAYIRLTGGSGGSAATADAGPVSPGRGGSASAGAGGQQPVGSTATPPSLSVTATRPRTPDPPRPDPGGPS